jgi:hypothetical protein
LKSSLQDTDFKITFTNDDKVVEATVEDDLDLGIFKVSITLTKAGNYTLRIELNDLEVPQSVGTIRVVPKQATSSVTSTFTGA